MIVLYAIVASIVDVLCRCPELLELVQSKSLDSVISSAQVFTHLLYYLYTGECKLETVSMANVSNFR